MQLHPEAQVGLVGAEALDDLVVGEARERDLQQRPLGGGRPRDLDGHLLDEGHDGVLVDEAHLEVELGELGLSVAAQVLVAEAAGDLVVAVDPGDHQQLLELLGALRQRVDGPRLEPARDDEVARALGRRLDEVRRLDLDEPVRVVDLVDRLDEPRPEQQPALHRFAPDIEIAVAQAERLVDRGIRLVDVERRRLRLGQDLERASPELDRAGLEAWVLGPGQPLGDGPLHRHDELAPDAARDRVGGRCLGRVDDDLGEAMPVAQVEEDELAMVASPMDPARQPRRLAGVGRTELPAGVTAVRGRERGWRRMVGHGGRIVVDRSRRRDRSRERAG